MPQVAESERVGGRIVALEAARLAKVANSIQRGDRFRAVVQFRYYRAGTVFEVGDRLEIPGWPVEVELIPVGVVGQSYAVEMGELQDLTRFEREKETR